MGRTIQHGRKLWTAVGATISKIYLAPAVKSETAYSSTHELLVRGGYTHPEYVPGTAYAKLLMAYDNFENQRDIERFLEQDIAFEHV